MNAKQDHIAIEDQPSVDDGGSEAGNERQDGIRTIQSVDRALSILEAVAYWPEGMTLSAISQQLDLNPSTCHHLVSTLVARGYLEHISRSVGYALGHQLRELQEIADGGHDPAVVLQDDLKRFSERLGYGAQLAVLRETALLTKLSVRGADASLPEPSELEKMKALHATATGKAILAWIPDTELVRIISDNGLTQYTPKTITSLSQLVEELRLVRRRKYAIDDEEFTEGVVCIGGAIRDKGGAVIASISVTLPADEATDDNRKRLIREITTAANDYSNKLRAKSR